MHDAQDIIQLLPLFALALGSTAACGADWSLEFFGGEAYNFDTRLRIEQDGGYSATVGAEYETRGFQAPVLYLGASDAVW
jgi:hypothetical protein